jgi:putative tryptophan/tyrosine transport system substrate-binding protein
MKRRQFVTLLGGVAAWPVAARAQQSGAVARIGFLQTARLESPEARANFDAFRQGLAALGYIEGQNIVIEQRGADGQINRLSGLASELVNLKVEVIVAGGTPGSRAAQQTTTTIPIVATAMGDPVQDGIVASLARPGGNITGTTFLGPELVPKRLAFFKELLPSMSRVAVLWHPGAFSEKTTNEMIRGVEEAATALGIQLQFVQAQSPHELERAFSEMATSHADGLFEFPSPMFFSERSRLVDLAALHRLPAMYNAKEFVRLGGLIAYGASILDLYRRAASYVDKILKGAKPSELPVEQPTKFELYVNVKTAKSLGLTVPPGVLIAADEVIE